MVRERHPSGASTRDTHRLSPVDYASPSDRLYSSQSDVEPTDGVNTGAGSITDGSIVDGGLDGSSAIKPGTIPGSALDTTPPPVPVLRALSSPEVVPQENGTSVVQIIGAAGYDIADPLTWDLVDLAGIVVQATYVPVFGSVPAVGDYTYAIEWTQGVDDDNHDGHEDVGLVLTDVVSATLWFLRCAAVDALGNRSSWSNEQQITSSRDAKGPPQPSGIAVTPGMNSFAVQWAPNSAPDFEYTEVQYRVAAFAGWAGDATSPPIAAYPAGDWVSLHAAGTLVVVTGVPNGVDHDPHALEVRLRAVDTSGNVKHDTVTGDPQIIDVRLDPPTTDEQGWVVAPNALPTALPGSALVWSDAIIGQVFAGKINADWVQAGTLRVGTGSHDADAIEVYNSAGVKIGRWTGGGGDPNAVVGLEIFDQVGGPAGKHKLRLTDSSLLIWDNLPTDTAPIVSISPLGIDAASVTFGSARGGHNLIPNSSFEMGPFVATPVDKVSTWGVKADWDLTRQGADTNVTPAAGSLAMASVT